MSNCPRCESELEMVGRCGYCHNPDCEVYNVMFRKEWNDYLITTTKLNMEG